MLVIRQKWIGRIDIQNNPTVLYLFGDNLFRQGWGGQAAEMRGEPNSFGIATKRTPYTTHQSYFYDSDPDVFNIIDDEFKRLKNILIPKDENNYPILGSEHPYAYDAIVVPSDGLGTGLSNLQGNAPKLLEYIYKNLKDLESL